MRHDVFISYASEDGSFARSLAKELGKFGLSIWFDQFSLEVGDSLHTVIQRGVSDSRFGVVVLSGRFFAKEWPVKELNSLLSLEVDGRKVILPVWHKISAADVRRYSPILADRVALSSSDGVKPIAQKLAKTILRAKQWTPRFLSWPNDSDVAILPLRRKDHIYVIGRHLVTNRQYRAFVAQTGVPGPLGMQLEMGPSNRKRWVDGFAPWQVARFAADDQPVVCVSADDARRYCRWLTKQLHEGAVAMLPTKQLWARAATAGEFDSLDDARNAVTFKLARRQSPPKVDRAGRSPNAWGVTDVFGCLWQWCFDRTTTVKSSSRRRRKAPIATIIAGDDEFDARQRVQSLEYSLAGGSFLDDMQRVRLTLSAAALTKRETTRHADLGFRIAGTVRLTDLALDVQQQLRFADFGRLELDL